jgi:hypothetical protein
LRKGVIYHSLKIRLALRRVVKIALEVRIRKYEFAIIEVQGRGTNRGVSVGLANSRGSRGLDLEVEESEEKKEVLGG